MSNITFVNMGGYRNQFGKYGRVSSYTEPAHLLAMHNICRRSGHRSAIVQFGYPSAHNSVRRILKQGPQFIALSFTGYFPEEVQAARDLVYAFPEDARPNLIIGGRATEHHLDELIANFSQITRRPLIFVTGPGERVMSTLAPHDFDMFASDLARLETGFVWDEKMKLAVIDHAPPIPLDEQGFERPYRKLSPFGRTASVVWQTGCAGSCSFCAGESLPVDYRSPARAAEEVTYLKRFGVRRIAVATANFTASPERASAILDTLPAENIFFDFASRVDTLYLAIQSHPESWRRFANKNWGFIELGVESLIAERLGPGRMGKYPTPEKAQVQATQLNAVLDFFKDSRFSFEFDLIPFDWRSSLNEVRTDLTLLIQLLGKYPQITGCENFSNVLRYDAGSALSKKMKPIDFYNFEQDPRALFLALIIRNKLKLIGNFFDKRSLVPSIVDHFSISYGVMEFTSFCLDRIEQIDRDRIKMDPVLAGEDQNGPDEVRMEGNFYDQLGWDSSRPLRKAIEEEFYRIFPGLKPPPPLTLPNTWFDRLGRFLLG